MNILFLVICVAIVFLIIFVWNRLDATNSIHRKAWKIVCKRFAKLSNSSLEKFVSNLSENDKNKSIFLLEVFGKHFGISAKSLLFDDKFDSLLKVFINELEAEKPLSKRERKLVAKYKIECISPHSYNIIYILEDTCNLDKLYKNKLCENKNDNEMIDFVINMTPCQFVSFFIPFIDEKKLEKFRAKQQ
jgi:hypothetical protein